MWIFFLSSFKIERIFRNIKGASQYILELKLHVLPEFWESIFLDQTWSSFLIYWQFKTNFMRVLEILKISFEDYYRATILKITQKWVHCAVHHHQSRLHSILGGLLNHSFQFQNEFVLKTKISSYRFFFCKNCCRLVSFKMCLIHHFMNRPHLICLHLLKISYSFSFLATHSSP